MLTEDKSLSTFPTPALLSPDGQPYGNLPCEPKGENRQAQGM